MENLVTDQLEGTGSEFFIKSDEEAKPFEEEFWKELRRIEKDNNIGVLGFRDFVFPNVILLIYV